MTKTNQKLNKLREKIAEYVEDVMKVKRGCKGYDKTIDKEVYYWAYGVDFNNPDGGNKHIWITESGGRNYSQDNKSIEILGREITLEDVLIALGECEELQIKINDNPIVKFVGHLTENSGIYIELEKRRGAGFVWTMNQPLENQIQETLEFLAEILIDD